MKHGGSERETRIEWTNVSLVVDIAIMSLAISSRVFTSSSRLARFAHLDNSVVTIVLRIDLDSAEDITRNFFCECVPYFLMIELENAWKVPAHRRLLKASEEVSTSDDNFSSFSFSLSK